MKETIYTRLQKKYGGKWVATSPKGAKVYAAGDSIPALKKDMERKHVLVQKATIGYIQEYGVTRLGPNLYIRKKTD